MENNKFENSASLVKQLTEEEKSKLSSEEKSDKLEAIYIAMPSKEKANATLEMMTAKRNQFELANALKPFTGNLFSQYVFGIGVLAMAVSTIVILMLINGFAVCEMLGVPDGGVPHRVGCLIVGGIGFFGPLAWGELGPWLAIPVSVFGMTLLPIAYITFLLMMNSKSLLGDRRPEGSSLLRWNILMIIATTVATLGAGWASYGKIGWLGPGLILIFGILALLTRQKTIPNTN